MAVNNIIGRAEVSDALLPDQTINEIIQTAPESSVILSRARKVQMSSKKAKQPVLSSLPDAYWLDGDTGLKQTTDAQWKGVSMTAEELAAVRPELDGQQIMQLLEIGPGPLVGQAYKYLLEVRLDEGPIGEAAATERLLAWYRERER